MDIYTYKQLAGNGTRVIAIKTTGENLQVNNDASGRSGKWRIASDQSFDKVIIYHISGEIYLGDFVQVEVCPDDKDYKYVSFRNLLPVGQAQAKWTNFCDGEVPARSGRAYLCNQDPIVQYTDDGERITEEYVEGGSTERLGKVYERDAYARAACVNHYGKPIKCAVCEFSFVNAYGDIGMDYIHVHHIVPISKRGGQYKVNPATDLVPVCPNCHAIIHARNISHSDLRERVARQRNAAS